MIIENQISKIVKIPVCCEDKYGLDFKDYLIKLNLNKEEILKFILIKNIFVT